MALSDNLRAKDWTFAATSLAAQRRRSIALYVLIASLSMFFSAALLGYLMIRFGGGETPPMHIPPILWLSTLFAFVGSGFLWASLRSVRRERQQRFRKQLITAFILGVGFCASQTIGLSILLRDHNQTMRELAAERAEQADESNTPRVIVPGAGLRAEELRDAGRMDIPRGNPTAKLVVVDRRLEGLVFVLVGLHALHFLGGMFALSIVTWRGLHGRYDHEYHGGLYLCAVYWRFLDVVWITLFVAFLLTD